MIDQEVRRAVYEQTMRTGLPPLAAEIAELLGIPESEVAASLRRLAEGRILVLQPETAEILMAAPYSAVPTSFVVEAAGVRAWGNCMWDALGIPAMLGCNGTITTSCSDCGTAAVVTVADGRVAGEGLVHFALPVRKWWDDIVFT